MKHIKSTKGTHVYSDDREDAPIPTLYIKRAALPNPPPTEIEVKKIVLVPKNSESEETFS